MYKVVNIFLFYRKKGQISLKSNSGIRYAKVIHSSDDDNDVVMVPKKKNNSPIPLIPKKTKNRSKTFLKHLKDSSASPSSKGKKNKKDYKNKYKLKLSKSASPQSNSRSNTRSRRKASKFCQNTVNIFMFLINIFIG